MTPEQWRDVERLYHAALAQDAGERAAFLAAACGADEALRREVESLLHYEAHAAGFIEKPAAPIDLAAAVRRLEEGYLPGRLVGRSLGTYNIQALIAAGGMGEVYRAVDTRLNRTVAIKTLPAHLLNDPERRERFEREARIVSSLNHPGICTLHDVGTEDNIQYLVMEYIEGETLQARLERGALPVAQALAYSIQIVDALDKAHRRGVTHRDLKPANVMLTKAGVKLLDFGLAMRSSPAAGLGLGPSGGSGSTALTRAGTIMGTPQYISPEQLEGKPADSRTDIFAFGAVAYEMLAGRAAFPATNSAQLVSAIMKDDPPPIVGLAPDVPPPLAHTISRCLAKDPDDRWQTANDLLFQLRAIATGTAIDVRSFVARPFPRWPERAAWAAIVVASAAAALLWTRGRVDRPDPALPGAALVRYSLFPAEGTSFSSSYESSFAVSPDGRHLAYVAVDAAGTKQLWLRSLDVERQEAMTGTEGATLPFWSADSAWIGFTAGRSLKKVRVTSGLVQPIAGDVSTSGGAAWNADDVIIFGSSPGGLYRVSARGGTVSRLTTTDEGSHFWPQFVGDGEHFIYAATIPGRVYLGSLGHEAPRILMQFSGRTSSLAHVPGYILFVQDAILFARPFDEKRLEFAGEPVRVVDGIPVIGPGRAPFSVSAAGVLAYWTYPSGAPTRLRWFDRDGHATAAVDTPSQYAGFALSPDGRRLVFSRAARSGGADVWLRDLSDGRETRLTFDGAAFTPQWSPDGTRIVFSGPGEGPPPKLFIKSLEESTAATRLGGLSKVPNFASSWSGDGRSIVSVRIDPLTGTDLWVQRVADGVGYGLPINTRSNESHAKVSPDSRWLAYTSDTSGKDEVWVASFPAGTIRRQVSIGGGSSPEWGEGSAEIVYLSADKHLMAAGVVPRAADIDVTPPRALFQVKGLAGLERLVFPSSNEYVATANGQRFLVAEAVRDPTAPPITLVVNWTVLLKR
ncbi:MAG: protein kinase [Vicinamibacterales bacterium]